MVKLFGVSKEEDIDNIESEDNNITFNDDNNINDNENDCGQVALDILETPYEIIILAPIAGIELSDIDLSFNKNILTIKGFRDKPEIYSSDIIIRNNECFWGKFIRNIILPENLDFNSIKASLENNLLIVTIKKLQFTSKNIKINRIEV